MGQWLAYDAMEPIGQSWEMARQVVSYLLMPHGQKEPLPHLRPVPPEANDGDDS